MFRGTKTSLKFTNLKPLTWLIKSFTLFGIYSRWAAELRSLHIYVVWIQGKQNIVSGAFSRTIFSDFEFNSTSLEHFGKYSISNNSESQWIWKDNKGGYEELLRKIGKPIHDSELKKYFRVESSCASIKNSFKFDYRPHKHTDTNQLMVHSNMSEIGTVISSFGHLGPNERHLK